MGYPAPMTTATTRDPAWSRRRTAGWSVAGMQGGYALVFAIAAVFAMTRYAADAMLDGMAVWLLLITVLQMGPLLAGVSLIASAWFLLTGYARGRRALTAALVAGAAVALATVVAMLTPAGQALIGRLTL